MAVGLVAGGCERAAQEGEAARKQRQLAQAIVRYSEAARQADEAARALTQAWNRAMSLDDVAALKKAMRQDVIPKMKAYIEALEAVPTQTSELARIHAALVQANRTFADEVGKFVEELREDHRVEPLEALRKALAERAAAEKRYLASIETYYAAHGIELATPGAAGKEEASSGSRPAGGSQPATDAAPGARAAGSTPPDSTAGP